MIIVLNNVLVVLLFSYCCVFCGIFYREALKVLFHRCVTLTLFALMHVCVPIQDRPSRTSNGSFDPQRGSMTQAYSPSMAQSPFSLSSHRSDLKSGYPSPQTNGLSYNSPLETEREEEHEPHPEMPQEEMTPYSSKSQLTEPTAGMALVIGEDLVNSERVSITV